MKTVHERAQPPLIQPFYMYTHTLVYSTAGGPAVSLMSGSHHRRPSAEVHSAKIQPRQQLSGIPFSLIF